MSNLLVRTYMAEKARQRRLNMTEEEKVDEALKKAAKRKARLLKQREDQKRREEREEERYSQFLERKRILIETRDAKRAEDV